MSKIDGLIAAPLTPFHPDGRINVEIIPAYAAFLHGNGVRGVFVNGTTGEGLSLTVSERRALAEAWVRAAPESFKVIIHVSHPCVQAVADLTTHAARIGAWGMGQMGPIFYRPQRLAALIDYTAHTAAQAPELPYYYYHIPSMSGVRFPMIDFLRAAAPRIPNLAGIKYTHEDLADYGQCLAFEDGRYDILYGRDETLLSSLALGSRGAVGSTYNLMAPLYTRLRQAFEAGDLDAARRLQQLSISVIRALIETESFNAALKEAIRSQGLDLGGVRLPLQNLNADTRAVLLNDLAGTGFHAFANRRESDHEA